MNTNPSFSRPTRRLFQLITVFLSLVGIALAELAPGDPFPEFSKMQDQHEQVYAMPKGVKHVAVAFTMGVGKSANGYFAEKGAEYLGSEKAVFVANIYGMPAVGRFFAMPKMKKYPHRIMLADTEGLLDAFPKKEDRVTVLDLDTKGIIQAVRYWDPKSDTAPF